jgi:hypothetical protein
MNADDARPVPKNDLGHFPCSTKDTAEIKSVTGAYRVGHHCAPASHRLRGAHCTIFRRLVFDLDIDLSAE